MYICIPGREHRITPHKAQQKHIAFVTSTRTHRHLRVPGINGTLPNITQITRRISPVFHHFTIDPKSVQDGQSEDPGEGLGEQIPPENSPLPRPHPWRCPIPSPSQPVRTLQQKPGFRNKRVTFEGTPAFWCLFLYPFPQILIKALILFRLPFRACSLGFTRFCGPGSLLCLFRGITYHHQHTPFSEVVVWSFLLVLSLPIIAYQHTHRSLPPNIPFTAPRPSARPGFNINLRRPVSATISPTCATILSNQATRQKGFTLILYLSILRVAFAQLRSSFDSGWIWIAHPPARRSRLTTERPTISPELDFDTRHPLRERKKPHPDSLGTLQTTHSFCDTHYPAPKRGCSFLSA